MPNISTASAKVFTLSFKPAFHNLVELLLSGYRFLQIHFFPFNRFRPLGRLRVTLPLPRGKYRFAATVACMKYEKTTFQWLKSTKLGIIINKDTRPILLDVDLRGYFLIKGRANGWTESGLLVNEMHLRERVYFLTYFLQVLMLWHPTNDSNVNFRFWRPMYYPCTSRVCVV